MKGKAEVQESNKSLINIKSENLIKYDKISMPETNQSKAWKEKIGKVASENCWLALLCNIK